MKEYFYQANSKAAPFFSDPSSGFVKAESPREAILTISEDYTHPCGLYALNIYKSADAFHKGEEALGSWICPEGKKAWEGEK